MRRQFDVRLSPQSAGGYAVIGEQIGQGGGGFEAQEKEFGHVRAKFRPAISPVDDGEYQKLIDGQRKEMGIGGNGVKRESMDCFKKLYDKV